MNDLIPRACCHISDKIGRNEKQEVFAPVFIIFRICYATGICSSFV